MSKAKLKKELANLDKEQLTQLILDLYSARKEAKLYFDFFLNPDETALYEKYCAVIGKEMSRKKYYNSKARISKVKAAIKEYESFGVSPETVIQLSCHAIRLALTLERSLNFTKSQYNGVAKLAETTMTKGDKLEIFDSTYRLMSTVLDGSTGARSFVNYLRTSIGWPAL